LIDVGLEDLEAGSTLAGATVHRRASSMQAVGIVDGRMTSCLALLIRDRPEVGGVQPFRRRLGVVIKPVRPG
jgi:hypothetical protein